MHPGVKYAESDPIHGGPHSRSSPQRRRNPMACLFCRRRKIKCEFNNAPDICDHCRSKATKCTVLSVAQEEALKNLGYTDESLMSLSTAELESLLRQLPSPPYNSADHTEISGYLTPRHYGPPSSSHHSLPSTGQDRSENSYRTYPSSLPYNNSAHHYPTASRTGSTNPATVPINTSHPQAHPHQQSPIYPNYTTSCTAPLPNHQVSSYQIPTTGGAPIPHHPMGDHQQLQHVHPNIPAHSNAVQSHNHANYSGQADYPFQAAQQPSQGQTAQLEYQYGGYPPTMALGYTRDVSWRR